MEKSARTGTPMPEEDIFALLPEVSRTFALSINALLPRACRKALAKGRAANPQAFAKAFARKDAALASDIALAYLLCRLLDTVEDDSALPAKRRAAVLRALGRALADGEHEEKALIELERVAPAIRASAAEKELLQKADALFARLRGLAPAHTSALCRHASEMAYGMADSVADDTRGLIQSRADLDRYCHYVAGTVGAMLSDLFIAQKKNFSGERAKILRANMESFARGLQLVNIIKDCRKDFASGRCFIPAEIVRASGMTYVGFFAVPDESIPRGSMDAAAFAREGSREGVTPCEPWMATSKGRCVLDESVPRGSMDAAVFAREGSLDGAAADNRNYNLKFPDNQREHSDSADNKNYNMKFPVMRQKNREESENLGVPSEHRRHEALLPLIEDASGDLDRAVIYTRALPRSMWRARLFCALPIVLARATLRMLRVLPENAETESAPASRKISRRRVAALVILTWPAAVSSLWLRLVCRK